VRKVEEVTLVGEREDAAGGLEEGDRREVQKWGPQLSSTEDRECTPGPEYGGERERVGKREGRDRVREGERQSERGRETARVREIDEGRRGEG
jgi:hypothetical protein